MKKTPNSRELFLITLKAELGVTEMDGNKVVSSINSDMALIQLFENILNGKIKVADMQVHSAREWVADTEFFKQDDLISDGIRNVSESQLKKGEFFVPTGIALLGAVLGGPVTDLLLKNADYRPIGEIAALNPLKQSEWFIRHDQKYVVPEHSTSQVFDTTVNETKGLFILDTPRFFKEQKRIEVNLKTSGTVPANHAVKVVLTGAGTLPN